jgi:DNA repair protein RAD16
MLHREADFMLMLCSFSDVVLLLGLVKFAQSGIKCVKLDGSMSMHARDVMIERFTNDPDCKVYTTALPHDVDLTCKFLGASLSFLLWIQW